MTVYEQLSGSVLQLLHLLLGFQHRAHSRGHMTGPPPNQRLTQKNNAAHWKLFTIVSLLFFFKLKRHFSRSQDSLQFFTIQTCFYVTSGVTFHSQTNFMEDLCCPKSHAHSVDPFTTFNRFIHYQNTIAAQFNGLFIQNIQILFNKTVDLLPVNPTVTWYMRVVCLI